MRKLNKEDGITLVEILAGLAITGILGILISSIYFYSFDSLHSGKDQLSLQRDVRNIMNTMAREIRYAVDIGLYESPQDITGFSCIYIEDGVLKQKRNGVEKNISSKENNITNIFFEIHEISEENYIISIRITARRNEQDYKLNTEILLDNINTYTGTVDTESVICYQNP